MTRLKDITFESNSLTGTNGADNATGGGVGINVASSSPIKGTYYAAVATSAAAAYVQEDVTVTDNIYATFIFRFPSNPSAIVTIFELRDGSGALLRIRLNTNGSIRLTDTSGGNVGDSSVLSTNTLYRVGIRYSKGTGSNAILEAYVAADGEAFGSAFASTNTGTSTAQVSRVRCGCPASSTVTLDFDNLRIDDASMPTDDVAGGNNTPMTVNITATVTPSISRNVAKTIVQAITSSISIQKTLQRLLSIVITTVLLHTKMINMIKNIISSVGITTSKAMAYMREVPLTVTAAISELHGLATLKTITITITATPSFIKDVQKTIAALIPSSVNIIKDIMKPVSINSAVQTTIQKHFDKVITATITTTPSAIFGRGYIKVIDIVVSTVNVTLSKNIEKTLSITQSIAPTIVKQVNKLINLDVPLGVSVARNFTKLIQFSSSVAITVSQTLDGIVNNIAFKKNSRMLLLGIKNTATRLFGKNTKTIIIQDSNNDSI